jgi:hypothetical protein
MKFARSVAGVCLASDRARANFPLDDFGRYWSARDDSKCNRHYCVLDGLDGLDGRFFFLKKEVL